jgi:ATP-dependent helicase YprA (DUF1998 family)
MSCMGVREKKRRVFMAIYTRPVRTGNVVIILVRFYLLAATQMNTPDRNATYDDYDNKICELWATLETCGYIDGTTAWMRELIKQWFGFPEPRDWQAECCSNLTQKRDVFLTAPTGSGKSITIFAPIIAN